jgi:hypothetical protein
MDKHRLMRALALICVAALSVVGVALAAGSSSKRSHSHANLQSADATFASEYSVLGSSAPAPTADTMSSARANIDTHFSLDSANAHVVRSNGSTELLAMPGTLNGDASNASRQVMCVFAREPGFAAGGGCGPGTQPMFGEIEAPNGSFLVFGLLPDGIRSVTFSSSSGETTTAVTNNAIMFGSSETPTSVSWKWSDGTPAGSQSLGAWSRG